MLQRGNTKLGPLIHTFSIPAIAACPGRSKLCEKLCYAAAGFFCMPSVRRALEQHWEATKKANFAKKMIFEITKAKARIVRIHVAGDFYSAAYVRKWIEIIQHCQGTTFFVYTRSWRVPAIMAELRNLAKLKNVRLWWSADSETDRIDGRPPRVRNVRVAYLVLRDSESVPSYANLVFRDTHTTLEKYRQGVLVCPAENGMTYTFGKMQCSRCQLCIKKRKMPSKEYNAVLDVTQLPILT